MRITYCSEFWVVLVVGAGIVVGWWVQVLEEAELGGCDSALRGLGILLALHADVVLLLDR